MTNTNTLKLEVKQIEGLMADLLTKYNAGLVSEVRYEEYMNAFTTERNEYVKQIIAEQNARMAKISETSTAKEEITVTVEDIPSGATHSQLTKYMELCQEKKYMPRSTQGWTSNIASKEIQMLIAHRPMSAKQKEMILSLQAEASEAGLINKTLNNTELTRVSAQQASGAIERLIGLMQANSDKLKPSNEQVKVIADFYSCPDVPFEAFNIAIMKSVTDNDGNVVSKRRVTRTELEAQIRDNMSRYEASQFISDNNPKVTAWKATRITTAQIRQVRTLEKRIYNLSSPRQVEQVVSDVWGDIIDSVPQGSARDTKWTVSMEDVQIPEADLRLMSKKDGDAFIKQLNIELYAKQDMLKTHDDQLSNDTERNEFGSLANNDEFNDFNNLLYSLQAIAGYSVDEFQDEVARVFFSELGEGTRSAKAKLFKSIMEFIELQLETGALSARSLVEMTENSQLGKDIVRLIARRNDSVFNALVYA